MKKLFKNPLFWLGLGIRLALIFMVLPVPVTDWYAPFLSTSTTQPTLDPWSAWLNQGGGWRPFHMDLPCGWHFYH